MDQNKTQSTPLPVAPQPATQPVQPVMPPTLNSQQEPVHSSKKPLLLLLGIILLLALIVPLSMILLSKNQTPTTAVPTAPIQSEPSATATPSPSPTLEEEVQKVDTGNPETDLKELTNDSEQL